MITKSNALSVLLLMLIATLSAIATSRVADACGSDPCGNPGASCSTNATCLIDIQYQGAVFDGCCCGGFICFYGDDNAGCSSVVCSSDGETCVNLTACSQ
jgi:hypothetical protein